MLSSTVLQIAEIVEVTPQHLAAHEAKRARSKKPYEVIGNVSSLDNLKKMQDYQRQSALQLQQLEQAAKAKEAETRRRELLGEGGRKAEDAQKKKNKNDAAKEKKRLEKEAHEAKNKREQGEQLEASEKKGKEECVTRQGKQKQKHQHKKKPVAVLKSKRQMEIDKLNKGEATLQRAIAYRMNVEAPVATPATSPVQVTPATQVPVPVLKRNRRGKTVDPLAVAITNSPQLSSNSSPQQAKRIALSPIKVRQAPATSRVPLSPIKVPLQCVDTPAARLGRSLRKAASKKQDKVVFNVEGGKENFPGSVLC